jgi:threonine/homoserine/homoserine lactone efflux protein
VLPPAPLLSGFLLASLILAMTPGPAVFYLLTRSVIQGRASGLASAAGVALGSLCNALAATLGLAALLALSPLAFSLVKYVGAGYLLWLGLRALRAGESGAALTATLTNTSLPHILRDAFMVALFNPTTTLFFGVFVPQFVGLVPAGQTAILPALLLSGIFILIAGCTDVIYATAAGSIHPWFLRHGGVGRAGKLVEGLVYIALGLFAALHHIN